MAEIVDGTKEYRMGYMRGAMEQQLITIRIACDWLKEHARAFGYAEATGVWDATYKYDSDMLVEQFCRAMQDARSHAEAVCQAAVDRMGID